jgi:hypothetical protein
VAGRTGVRGRDRGLQPAARPGVHPAGDLLRLAAPRSPRRAGRRGRVHRARAGRDPGPVRAVPGRFPAAVGARRRSRRRGRRPGGRRTGGLVAARPELAGTRKPGALGGLPAGRSGFGRHDRGVAGADPGGLRRDRAGRPAPASSPGRRPGRRGARHHRAAGPRRRCDHGRGTALSGVGRVQGGRPVLRRRFRDHSADAIGRGRPLPLDDRGPVPQRRGPGPDHPRPGRADRGGGRLRRGRPGGGHPGLGGRLHAVVQFRAARSEPVRPAARRPPGPRLSRWRRARRDRGHSRLGHPADPRAHRAVAVRRPGGRAHPHARAAPRRRPHPGRRGCGRYAHRRSGRAAAALIPPGGILSA